MKAEDWRRVRDAFERARALPQADRTEYLSRELEGREDLRSRVEKMIRADEETGGFLEPPPLDQIERAPLAARTGTRIGSFLIGELIAGGGMGAVYEARQDDPARRVALKMLRRDLATEDARRRFRDEIALLARLKHPGIAQIYEAGTLVEGQGPGATETPWFAMELVENGRSLVQYARAEKLNLANRIALFSNLCDAVHHGHQRGVIHRDLKPANLLVDAAGRAKVIDFGVAKATDGPAGETQTQAGSIVGTLLYMSPEQVEGASDEIDLRTDVYALGVVLYELLADTPPFDLSGLTLTAASRVITEQDPPKLNITKTLPDELDWIVQKALAKDRSDRYRSVLELSEDLERFQSHEALRAGPRSRTYHLKKFVRRHRIGVGATGLVLAALIIGGIGTVQNLFRAQAAERLAVEEGRLAREAEQTAKEERAVALDEAVKAREVVEFLVDVLSSPDPGQDGRDALVVDALERASENYETHFKERPQVSARLASALGVVFHGLGFDERAVEHLEVSLDTLERTRDRSQASSSADRARVLRELGIVRVAQGEVVEAESLLEDSLLLYEGLGDESGIHHTRAILGQLRLEEAKLPEATEYLSGSLAWMREHLGDSNSQTLLTMNALAGAYHRTGKLEEAEALYVPALEGMTRQYGEEHPDVITLRSNYAMLLHANNRTDESIAILAELLELRRATLGPNHPETLGNISNLGGLYYLAGRYDDAAPLMAEGLENMERVLPATHPALQAMQSNLAALERIRKNFTRAEELYDAVYATRLEELGEEHPRTIDTLYEMAQNSRLAGELETAHERVTRGMKIVHRTMDDANAYIYAYERELGMTLAAMEKFEEAETILLAAIETHKRSVVVSPLLVPPFDELIQLYEAWSKPEEAERYRALQQD